MIDLISYGAITTIVIWVIFLGGAEWLEGTITSAFLVHPHAPFWHAPGIKLYVGLSWVGGLLWLLLA